MPSAPNLHSPFVLIVRSVVSSLGADLVLGRAMNNSREPCRDIGMQGSGVRTLALFP